MDSDDTVPPVPAAWQERAQEVAMKMKKNRSDKSNEVDDVADSTSSIIMGSGMAAARAVAAEGEGMDAQMLLMKSMMVDMLKIMGVRMQMLNLAAEAVSTSTSARGTGTPGTPASSSNSWPNASPANSCGGNGSGSSA